LVETPDFNGQISSTQRGIYANCAENVFSLTDLTKLSDVYLTDLATKTWFEGYKEYDFDAGKAKSAS
jgi:hypothetical protein